MNYDKQKKYGYKGSETALTGLINWMENRIRFNGSFRERCQFYFEIIIDYGMKQYPDVKLKGRPSTKADTISKLVQRNFSAFAKWISNKYLKQ